MIFSIVPILCRTAGKQELQYLLATPEKYIDEESSCPLPELLPQRRTEMEVKDMFPRQYEIQGFCPVTYIDGKKRYIYIPLFDRLFICFLFSDMSA